MSAVTPKPQFLLSRSHLQPSCWLISLRTGLVVRSAGSKWDGQGLNFGCPTLDLCLLSLFVSQSPHLENGENGSSLSAVGRIKRASALKALKCNLANVITLMWSSCYYQRQSFFLFPACWEIASGKDGGPAHLSPDTRWCQMGPELCSQTCLVLPDELL